MTSAYACKYCGMRADSMNQLTNRYCYQAEKVLGFKTHCEPVPNDDSHAVCEYCGRHYANSDVGELCNMSCSSSPTGHHVARG